MFAAMGWLGRRGCLLCGWLSGMYRSLTATSLSPPQGCINDAQCMHYMLKTKFGVPDTEVLMLRDDSLGRRDPRLMPTRGNIVAGMQWLLSGAKAGDRLFFHFSGECRRPAVTAPRLKRRGA